MRRSFQGPSAGQSRDGRSARQGERGAALRWVFLGGLVLLATGCSGGPPPPPVSPPDAAREAMAEYDTNKDGALDAKELEASPGLHGALKRADKNNDGRLSADEVSDRLAYFQQQGMQMDVTVALALDNRPLPGATVTLVPEKLMGSSVKPAKAVTDEEGNGLFKTEGEGGVPVAPGYYRIQVSKIVQGRELLPPKYNTQTILGQEVVPDAEGRGTTCTLKLRLSRR